MSEETPAPEETYPPALPEAPPPASRPNAIEERRRLVVESLRVGNPGNHARELPLQADPTVIYGIDGFDGNLKRRDLAAVNPYNTYVVRGLPPGPIAAPGRASLAAVLNPARVDYLYFVARNDGTHQFSRTLAELPDDMTKGVVPTRAIPVKKRRHPAILLRK